MKAYLITTGLVFALITLAHVARIFVEGQRLVHEPFFMILTVLTAALTVWSWRLFRKL